DSDMRPPGSDVEEADAARPYRAERRRRTAYGVVAAAFIARATFQKIPLSGIGFHLLCDPTLHTHSQARRVQHPVNHEEICKGHARPEPRRWRATWRQVESCHRLSFPREAARSSLPSPLWSRLLGVRSISRRCCGWGFQSSALVGLAPGSEEIAFLAAGAGASQRKGRRSVEPFRSPHRRTESKHLYRFRLVSAQL